MAIAVISNVPTSSGMKPKEAGVEVGDHCVPKRNDSGETSRKKMMVSNSTEKTMPMVVRMATPEQAISTKRMKRSKLLRARKSPLMRG